ncbi:MAG: hypothetical protein ABW128_16275 [Rhizorhabdus sp.]
MQSSQIPNKSQRVFAQDASGTYVRPIPQTSGDPAAASFSQGFPPQTFTDEGAGGTPPDGRDFNGLFNFLSAWQRWMAAGAPATYDATFQSGIGGYPLGAIVMSATQPGVSWRSVVENNTTNPDTGGAGWVLQSGTTSGNNANGYWTRTADGQGGFVIRQWGSVILPASGVNVSTTSIVFPTAFTAPGTVRANFNPADVPNPGGWDGCAVRRAGSFSTTGVTIQADTCAGTAVTGRFLQAVPVDWTAQGY